MTKQDIFGTLVILWLLIMMSLLVALMSRTFNKKDHIGETFVKSWLGVCKLLIYIIIGIFVVCCPIFLLLYYTSN